MVKGGSSFDVKEVDSESRDWTTAETRPWDIKRENIVSCVEGMDQEQECVFSA